MKKLGLLMILSIALFATSCETQLFNFNCLTEEGEKAWEEISLDAFHSVKFPGDSKVTFQEGEQNIMVYSTPNVIDALLENGSVSNGVWNAQITSGCARVSRVEYIITLPRLEGVKISGSADVFTEGKLTNLTDLDLEVSGSADFDMNLGEVEQLDMKISGSGTFNMNVDTAQQITSKISGSGTFNMNGFANVVDINISGGGTIENFDLITNTCNIGINGNGNCEVHVLNELNVNFSGGGKVCYKGNPVINTDISGSGKVNNCN